MLVKYARMIYFLNNLKRYQGKKYGTYFFTKKCKLKYAHTLNFLLSRQFYFNRQGGIYKYVIKCTQQTQYMGF